MVWIKLSYSFPVIPFSLFSRSHDKMTLFLYVCDIYYKQHCIKRKPINIMNSHLSVSGRLQEEWENLWLIRRNFCFRWPSTECQVERFKTQLGQNWFSKCHAIYQVAIIMMRPVGVLKKLLQKTKQSMRRYNEQSTETVSVVRNLPKIVFYFRGLGNGMNWMLSSDSMFKSKFELVCVIQHQRRRWAGCSQQFFKSGIDSPHEDSMVRLEPFLGSHSWYW